MLLICSVLGYFRPYDLRFLTSGRHQLGIHRNPHLHRLFLDRTHKGNIVNLNILYQFLVVMVRQGCLYLQIPKVVAAQTKQCSMYLLTQVKGLDSLLSSFVAMFR